VRRQLAIAALTILAVALVVTLTNSPKTGQEVPAAGGVYVEGVVGHPTYLNPLLAPFNDADDDVASLAFSGLTRLSRDGTVVPDLSTSWTTSPDGLVYTFTMRNATWQDGQPVTADDVVFTVGLAQSPTFPGSPELTRLWQKIKVAKVDQHTVQFTLTEPYAPFLEYTTLGLLPEHLLRGITGRALLENPFNAHPVGTGPFQVRDASLRQVSLVANPRYYGKQPLLSGITFQYFDTFDAAVDALHRGDVQGLGAIPPSRVLDLANDPKLNLVQAPEYARLSLVVLNTQNPLFADDLVRRALDLAVDRAEVIRIAADGEGVPAEGPVSPVSWAFSPQVGSYSRDPAQAAKLLEDAGWRLGAPGAIRMKDGKPFHFVLLAVNETDRQRAAEEISRQLRLVGVDAQVQVAGWSGIVENNLVSRQFDAVLTEAYSPTADPDPYPFWHSSQVKGGLNVAGWSNRIADQLLEDGRREVNRATRQDDYGKFQSLFAQQQPSILLFHPVYAYAVPASLKGVGLGLILQPSDRFLTVSDWYLRTRTEAGSTP
jgi:peptide/nickel transport system substrate-binding protein